MTAGSIPLPTDLPASPTVLLFTLEGSLAAFYRERLPDGWVLETLDTLDEDEKLDKARRAHVIVHADIPITRAHLDAAESLVLVQRQGVGLDALDLDALRERGVAAAVCADGTTEAVAEHTIMLMLAAGRHLPELHRDVTERSRWPKWDYRHRAVSLAGTTVGIVGFGRIGQAVTRLLLAFGSNVLVHRRPGRPHLSGEWPDDRVRACDSMEELFSSAAIVSLHCPLVAENRGLVNSSLLRRMPPYAVLVNTARGGLIVEHDLVAALRDGTLLAAGLDTLGTEPPPADHPLFSLPNVVLTPHLGAGTRQSQFAKTEGVYANIARVWEGHEPLNRVL